MMREDGNLRYTTLLFDVDNTLLNFDASEEEAFKSLLLHFGMEPKDSLLQEYHQINRSCWELFEEGKMEKEEVLLRRFEMFGALVGKVFQQGKARQRYFLVGFAVITARRMGGRRRPFTGNGWETAPFSFRGPWSSAGI